MAIQIDPWHRLSFNDPERTDMFEFTGELEPLVNFVFLAATAAVAWNAIRWRGPDGETDFVRLLFGCIAATFFMWVLFVDVLGVG